MSIDLKKKTQAAFYFSNIINDLLVNDDNNIKRDALIQCFQYDEDTKNIKDSPNYSDFINFTSYLNENRLNKKSLDHTLVCQIKNMTNDGAICDYIINLYKQIYLGM